MEISFDFNFNNILNHSIKSLITKEKRSYLTKQKKLLQLTPIK